MAEAAAAGWGVPVGLVRRGMMRNGGGAVELVSFIQLNLHVRPAVGELVILLATIRTFPQAHDPKGRNKLAKCN